MLRIGKQALKFASRVNGVRYLATSPSVPKPLSINDLYKMKKAKTPITMVTAYDYPSAVHVDIANIDVVLVGDSVGMVELGYDTTLPVTMDEMLHHCRAVARGVSRSIIVGDMPFGSYETCDTDAVRNAIRFLKDGNVDAIKLEGGRRRVETIKSIVRAGVAVMGHIGLTPQAISILGGFLAQGRTAQQARSILEDALALQDAGCFSLVIECVPAKVAKVVTEALEIPVIGIGAGPYTDGQVLVFHDMCGLYQHPHHAKVTPKFSKRFGNTAEVIQASLNAYREEVLHRTFPSAEYSPYSIPDAEWEAFQQSIQKGHLQSQSKPAQKGADMETIESPYGTKR